MDRQYYRQHQSKQSHSTTNSQPPKRIKRNRLQGQNGQLELDLRRNRRSNGSHHSGANIGKTQRPDVPPSLNQHHLPFIDAEVILTVHVTNPNAVPIHYSPTEMSIFYAGSLLGSARVSAGSQPPRSCQLLHLPERLNSVELAHHAVQFLADVRRREMVLDATVDIEGVARVVWWRHRFKVHVESHVTVDPVFLDVIDQENKSDMELFVT
ncbi:hypothetical protein L1987_84124 [Smallanthus sonchifolius]|uniref:Uncharacterized protein n=1 Tax=Smallanthus sonchifolius TaxID=185202 RepID=A0ACB8YI17_9ASTR|nr:hypothetical protein L1987_84124 [Smallanthus sonchifolius]